MNQTATSASAYTPTREFLDRTTAIYGPDSSYRGDMVGIEAAAREHAYLSAIAEALADPTGGTVLATAIDTVDHGYVPVLDFPAFFDHDNGFAVWANWESDEHEFSIVPFAADEFPTLPAGRTPDDHLKAAAIIRAYAKRQNLV